MDERRLARFRHVDRGLTFHRLWIAVFVVGLIGLETWALREQRRRCADQRRRRQEQTLRERPGSAEARLARQELRVRAFDSKR